MLIAQNRNDKMTTRYAPTKFRVTHKEGPNLTLIDGEGRELNRATSAVKKVFVPSVTKDDSLVQELTDENRQIDSGTADSGTTEVERTEKGTFSSTFRKTPHTSSKRRTPGGGSGTKRTHPDNSRSSADSTKPTGKVSVDKGSSEPVVDVWDDHQERATAIYLNIDEFR